MTSIWLQARLGKRRCEEVRARNTPEHLALGSSGHAGGEQGRGRAVDRTVSATGDFVQSAERPAAAWQTRVHGGEAEGQHRLIAPVGRFDLPDLDARRYKGGRCPQRKVSSSGTIKR